MKLTRRDKYLRKKYQITEAVYLQMLALYDGKCWICKKKPKKSPLNVDHDWKTGQVRGLLCWFCNKFLINKMRIEHAWKFRNAAEYLESTVDWRKVNETLSVSKK